MNYPYGVDQCAPWTISLYSQDLSIIKLFSSIHFYQFIFYQFHYYSIHFRTHIKQTLQIFTTLVVRRRNPPFSACMHPAIKKSLTRVKTTTKICLQILLNSVEIITWRCAWGPWLRKIASSCTQFSTLDASCS